MGITKRHHKIAIFNYKKREHNFTIIIYIKTWYQTKYNISFF